MMYCPICKSEYREGFEFCSTCNCSLVEELHVEQVKELISKHMVFLINVRDACEADMLESLMNSNNIEVTRKYREAGSYLNVYMGNTVLGVDIYVLENDYEAAKELLEIEQEDGVEEKDTEYVEEDMRFDKEAIINNKRRAMKAWIILLFFVPGIFIPILISIITLIVRLLR